MINIQYVIHISYCCSVSYDIQVQNLAEEGINLLKKDGVRKLKYVKY